MFKQDISFRTDGYFTDGGDMTIEGLSVSISGGVFTKQGMNYPMEAIRLDLPTDAQFSINTRLYLLRENESNTLYYHCQSAYISNGGGATYVGDDELIDVMLDVEVKPDGSMTGFAQEIKDQIGLSEPENNAPIAPPVFEGGEETIG